MAALQAAEVPFLIGGAYVVEVYAGVSRRTKDFDLYIRPNHLNAALAAFARAGYNTEVTFPHWLAKARHGRDIVDLIFALATDCAKWMVHGSSARATVSCWVCL